ncbi:hypothetical protein RND81_05G062100 [Saponaria officinalis]|uniref:RING-type domain-containing protein n=1 Tax=Saponaria officinalis TaxID=3572 RepID=A0AAW1KV95_SAPOF
MGQQQSKDESLYQQVCCGNVDSIKSLHAEGAGLEYKDREGKTPLIAACLNPALHGVVKLLIELGANVNAYRPGRNGGTPLHHAAKRGLENTVNVLLSHGANALLLNDDCQTALDIARAKGLTNIVRTIESHICLYAGWLRELFGPGFLELLAPQLISRKVWAVVVPMGSSSLRKPFKLELAIYTSVQDAQPRLKIALSRASMEEPAFNQPDPAVVIAETSTISRRGRQRRCKPRRVCRTQTRIKLAPVSESDKQQLQQFCNACKGIPQVMHSNFPFNNPNPVVPSLPPTATAPPPTKLPTATEDMELAMAIRASLESARQQGLPVDHFPTSDGPSSSTTVFHSTEPSSSKGECTVLPPKEEATPSAPIITDEDESLNGPIHYPTIDFSTMDMSGVMEPSSSNNEDGSKKGKSSSCVICFDAPVEAACVPCGHMAGCMSCLNEIKAKNWGCPVCRANIDQVIKVFSV